MADLSQMEPWKRAPLLGAGLGLIGGGFEAIQLSVTLKLSMTFFEGLMLGISCALLGGVLGALFSIVAGVLAQGLTRSWLMMYRRHALSMALTSGALGLWYLLPAAQGLFEEGRAQAALAFSLTPIGIIGVIWFNAVFWLRREYVEGSPRLGWWFWSVMGALVLSAVSGGMLSRRAVGEVTAIETDPDVVLITLEGWRHDYVSGGAGAAPVQTPALEALATEGLRFTNAITPMPVSLPAHAAILTGLHPARNKVISNGHRLSLGYTTLPERLLEEGYATGGFIGSVALSSDSGLSQGFQVYDDDFSPGVRGVLSMQLVQILMRGAVAVAGPQAVASLLRRSPPETLERASAWLQRNADRPAFAMIHLSVAQADQDGRVDLDPSAYAARIAEADAQLGAFIDELRQPDRIREVIVVVCGLYGAVLPSTESVAGHRSLYDEVVRVPLVIVPVRMASSRRVIPEQVRLMDMLSTVLKQLRLDPPEKTESGELVRFSLPAEHRGFSTLLLGRGGQQVGYRARNSEGGYIKYIWAPEAATEADAQRLYDLRLDPEESEDLLEKQAEVASRLQETIQRELGTARLKADGFAPEVRGLRLSLLQAAGELP